MLVLTRKLGQKIVINDSIVITVVNLEDHRVQIGIEAPKSVPIFRYEIIEKVAGNNKDALGQDIKHIQRAAKRIKNFASRLTQAI
ncbi:MAG: hypothetical protein Kow00108_07100 [Calditrichia bacterium]